MARINSVLGLSLIHISDEVALKRCMIESAKKVVAVCDHTKFHGTITNSAGRRVWGFMGIEAVARPHINEFTDASQCTYVPEDWRD